MHVASQAGSHVIVRREKNSGPPPNDILQKAASLAAWFSKARNAPFAKIHVTETRFIGKEKNAPAGEVTVRKFKTIRAAPTSPLKFFHDLSTPDKQE
jgi:predicted ribosome quality control (RQC) complex YloA/Tae2 family protein